MTPSSDAILQAIATLSVGVIFLVTLRQALGLRVTSRFIIWILAPIYFWTVAAAILLFESELSFIPPCAPLSGICLTSDQIARLLVLAGLVAMAIVVWLTSKEAARVEKRGKP